MQKGFSLIELIVVVAIVGIISAIAAPTYKSYLERAKYASMRPVVAGFIEQSKGYYGKNGVWPNAYQLGYDAEEFSGRFNNPEVINPDLTEIYIVSNSGLTPCSEIGSVEFAFKEDLTSYSDAALFWYFADVNGVIETTCQDESDTGTEIVGSECVNPRYPTLDDLAAVVCP